MRSRRVTRHQTTQIRVGLCICGLDVDFLEVLCCCLFCRINFFLGCSVIGLVVLLPVNYCCNGGLPEGQSQSLDSFTIANIGKGSNW